MVHNAAVSTPSERLWARRPEWDDERSPPGERAGPLSHGRVGIPLTLAATAHRIVEGTELRGAVADFLDDLRWAHDEADVGGRVDVEPRLVTPHADAYLGALAEHVAGLHRLVVPAWTRKPERFLDHFWWPSRTVGLQARALVESPAAFRRRGIFIGRSTLQRV